MPVNHTLTHARPSLTTSGIPRNYNGHIIQGAEQLYIVDNFGLTVTQTIDTGLVSITEHQFEWYSLQEIWSHYNYQPGLFTCVGLGEPLTQGVKGVGELTLGRYEFASLTGNSFISSVLPGKTGSYNCIVLWWSAEFLREILYEDAALRLAIGNTIAGYPEKILCPPLFSTPAITETLTTLRTSDHSLAGSKKLIHEKMKKLARLVIKESRELNESRGRFTPATWEKIRTAKEIIDAGPLQNSGSEILARQIGISETILKRGFKALTGMAVLEYKKFIVLNHIGRLILRSNEPVKYFIDGSGYTSPDSFRRAFRKLFWCTPSELRNEKWGPRFKETYSISPEEKKKYGELIIGYMSDRISDKQKQALGDWIESHEHNMQLFDDLTDDNKTAWSRQWFAAAGIDDSTVKWKKTGGWERPDPLRKEKNRFYWVALALLVYAFIMYLLFIH